MEADLAGVIRRPPAQILCRRPVSEPALVCWSAEFDRFEDDAGGGGSTTSHECRLGRLTAIPSARAVLGATPDSPVRFATTDRLERMDLPISQSREPSRR